MFKGPAALTTGSIITTSNATVTGGTINGVIIGGTTTAAGSFTSLAATGNITTSAGDLIVSGGSNKLHLQGGAGLQFASSTKLDTVATGAANNNIVPTRGYVDDAVANAGGGALAANIVFSTTTQALAPNTTYFMDSTTSAIACNLTVGTLANGSLVRFVFKTRAGSNNSVLTCSTGISSIQPVAGSTGTILTFDDVGQSIQFVFCSVNTSLYIVSGGATLA
jgi:hypothetical protein